MLAEISKEEMKLIREDLEKVDGLNVDNELANIVSTLKIDRYYTATLGLLAP